jgi:hypothetical protein
MPPRTRFERNHHPPAGRYRSRTCFCLNRERQRRQSPPAYATERSEARDCHAKVLGFRVAGERFFEEWRFGRQLEAETIDADATVPQLGGRNLATRAYDRSGAAGGLREESFGAIDRSNEDYGPAAPYEWKRRSSGATDISTKHLLVMLR